MSALSNFIVSRLDLVFFAYGLAFSAIGLLLFLQPKKNTSFSLADQLWLLGVFGLLHGLNEFLDMWEVMRPQPQAVLAWLKFSLLAASFLFLLEFGRRAMLALYAEKPAFRPLPEKLLGGYLTPALAAAAAALSFFNGDFLLRAPVLARVFVCFPGAVMSGLAFLGYAACKKELLLRLRARRFFVLTGWAFLIYAALSGLVLPPGHFFPAALPDYQAFIGLTGLPVQLFRAACAVVILTGVIGSLRIFREHALQVAQQELLDIIEFFPDATFVVDKDRKVIAWNRALEHMTGVPKKDVLGKGDYAYSVPFYGERRPILIDLIGTPNPEAARLYKYVRRRQDGAIYAEVFVPSLYGGRGAHVWVTASPLKDGDGNVYGAIESVRDVTDKKLSEEALHQSEAQYRALIETTNTGFLIIDDKGTVLDANREYARMTGRAGLEELRGKNVLEWTAPYERQKNANAMARCGALGHIRNFEVDYVTPENKIIPVELNATVVEIGGKKLILTLCRDITDRRKAEDKIKESERKFRTLTEKSLVGVYLVQDGVFKYVNPKLAEIFGYSVDEMTATLGPKDVVQPGDWAAVAENLRRRLDGEISDVNYSFRGRRRDGSELYIEVFGSRSEYEGRPAVLGTLLDITARKRAEQELLEAKAGLEKRVEERTAELADLNRELEAFSYSAAHDLKAPLRRVNIFSEMLEGEAAADLKPPQKEHLRNIRKAVSQMSALVQGLLDLSTTGKKPLEKTEVDLAELARETAAEAALPGGPAVTWEFAVLPKAECDRAMIKQVLSNLLSNAVKYSRGAATPKVAVSYRLENGQHVIGVKDNGVGFSMDNAGNLFGVFQRLHRQEDFEGTGIGLSIVKRIVTRHGGRVWAESSPGNGAAFFFTLPA